MRELLDAAERSLKILYVTSYLPGSNSGAPIRILNIGRLLKRVGQVSLLTASPEEIGRGAFESVQREISRVHIAKVLPDPEFG